MPHLEMNNMVNYYYPARACAARGKAIGLCVNYRYRQHENSQISRFRAIHDKSVEIIGKFATLCFESSKNLQNYASNRLASVVYTALATPINRTPLLMHTTQSLTFDFFMSNNKASVLAYLAGVERLVRQGSPNSFPTSKQY